MCINYAMCAMCLPMLQIIIVVTGKKLLVKFPKVS